jgi:hypothetical protein
VLKKAFQIIVTFSVLVGCYRSYLLAFAALTDRIGTLPTTTAPAWAVSESRTAREATRLASETLGPNHWASQKDVKIRVYDSERGFYMYAGNEERLEEGRKFRFWPFAIIWLSKDGNSRKSATSETALIELNDKMGVIKQGSEALHVVEARLENEVILRDDKGTLDTKADDLVVGPLPYLEYTEKTNPPEIRSKSNIKVVDRDLTLSGFNLLIQLRRGDATGASTAGFDVQTATLGQNVDLVVKDVGKAGVLPGTTKTAPTNGGTPLHLKSDGEMRIDFPPKVQQLRANVSGPQLPESPTFATFQRNVVVDRGEGALKDTLNCDTLLLTLLPTEKPMQFEPRPLGLLHNMGLGVMAPGSGGVWPHYGKGGAVTGPLTELSIRQANAKGYAVWLTSTAQGVKTKCDELIYKKLMPYAADETYLRGNLTSPIYVEKIDYATPQPNPGPITSVVSIWALDAKIFDDGKGGNASTVVSRGPGRLEMRPAPDKPADYKASWQNDLLLRTVPFVAEGAAFGDSTAPQLRRLITLRGDPKLEDVQKQMKLEAKQLVTVSMKPKAKSSEPQAQAFAASAQPAQGPAALSSGSTQIEWIQARENVRLSSPGKIMIARDELNAPFEQVAMLASEPVAPPVAQAAPGADPFSSNAELPKVDGPAFAAAKAAEPAQKPKEPDVLVTAHRVWAKIRQANGRSEIAEARLRGQVKFHQDPAPNRKRGTDVAGEALDLETVSGGKMKFKLFNTDPSAMSGETRIAANGDPKLTPRSVARIDTEEYTIVGNAIGMDQAVDLAWVNGSGYLIQMTERGFLNDKGIKQQYVVKAAKAAQDKDKKEKEKPDGTKVPFKITWTDQMRFFGRTSDPDGRPAGKIEFRGDVHAMMEDAHIAAEEIDTYTDRPVSLSQAVRSKPRANVSNADVRKIDELLPVAVNAEDVPAGGEADGQKADLAFLDARNSVDKHKAGAMVRATNVKRDPETGEKIEVQFITGDRIVYDRRTGDYFVPGKGEVFLWRRGAEGVAAKSTGLVDLPGARPTIKPLAETGGLKVKKYSPWEHTRIQFAERMKGRFGSGKDQESDWRTADFYGAVQVMNANVVDDRHALGFDSKPSGFKFMTADSLRIVSIPPDSKDKGASAQTFITAESNASARTGTSSVTADVLKYDSTKDQFLGYGLNGREVVVISQGKPGQPPSKISGEAAEYDHKTGASKLIQPNTIQLLDGNGGNRAVQEKAPIGAAGKPANQRPSLRPPPSNNLERRGFGSGR